MRLLVSFFNIVIIWLAFGVLLAYAHVGIGEYAGTHVVAFVPQPRSPLVGETVQMRFNLRDLHGNFANEQFVVAIEVMKVLPDSTESTIFASAPEMIADGIYESSYRFQHPGNYRVEYGFSRPSEPDIVRDAVFDIEVRDVSRGIPYTTAIATVLVIAAAVGVWFVNCKGRKLDNVRLPH